MELYYEMFTMSLKVPWKTSKTKWYPKLCFIGWVKFFDKINAPMHSFVSLFS